MEIWNKVKGYVLIGLLFYTFLALISYIGLSIESSTFNVLEWSEFSRTFCVLWLIVNLLITMVLIGAIAAHKNN